jgi:hypothetical protein
MSKGVHQHVDQYLSGSGSAVKKGKIIYSLFPCSQVEKINVEAGSLTHDLVAAPDLEAVLEELRVVREIAVRHLLVFCRQRNRHTLGRQGQGGKSKHTKRKIANKWGWA